MKKVGDIFGPKKDILTYKEISIKDGGSCIIIKYNLYIVKNTKPD